MKKIILVLSLVLVLGLGTMFAYATETPVGTTAVTAEEKEANEWFEERMEYRRDQLKEALVTNEITQVQYDAWLENIKQMEEFHEENGFINGGGFGAGCNGAGRGANGFGGMMRGGFSGGFNGGGMMRNGSNGWNNN